MRKENALQGYRLHGSRRLQSQNLLVEFGVIHAAKSIQRHEKSHPKPGSACFVFMGPEPNKVALVCPAKSHNPLSSRSLLLIVG